MTTASFRIGARDRKEGLTVEEVSAFLVNARRDFGMNAPLRGEVSMRGRLVAIEVRGDDVPKQEES